MRTQNLLVWAQEKNLLTPPPWYYVGRTYLPIDAISFFTKQVKIKQKSTHRYTVLRAPQGKKGHHRAPQEWNLRHITTTAAMRGIQSDEHINILMKYVIYYPMTLLVMGEVHHQRLCVGRATPTTQEGTTHTHQPSSLLLWVLWYGEEETKVWM